MGNHEPSSEGTRWEYEVKWDDMDEKDKPWEPEENMTKEKEMVTQYCKEIGGQRKVKRNAAQTTV